MAISSYMTPHEATRELYRLIFTYKDKLLYDDVKICINSGALLKNIESSYGIPLLFAINSKCNYDIIELLANSGGVDFDNKTPTFSNIWYDFTPQPPPDVICDDLYFESLESNILDVDFIYYNSLYTCLLQLYHMSINSPEFEVQTLHALVKRGIIEYKDIVEFPSTMTLCDQEIKTLHTRFETLCKICDVNPNDIKSRRYDFPPDMLAFNTIPKNRNSYNWSYDRDIYYADNVLDSSDDE